MSSPEFKKKSIAANKMESPSSDEADAILERLNIRCSPMKEAEYKNNYYKPKIVGGKSHTVKPSISSEKSPEPH